MSNTGFGLLGCLPVEILQDVLLRLDMRALFNLRQASLRSRQAVDSLKQYHLVVSHGLDLFCALLRTELAASISLSSFYDALCTKSCAWCGKFAGFMFLPSWQRCCYACLTSGPEAQMLTRTTARKQFQLTKVELDQLTSFRTLPGFYSMKALQRTRTTLVHHRQVLAIAGPEALAKVQTDECRRMRERSLRYNYMVCCALPYYDRRNDRVEYGLSCAGCQLALNRGPTCEERLRDTTYAQDGFLEHFRQCLWGQRFWERRADGDKETVDYLPYLPGAGGLHE